MTSTDPLTLLLDADGDIDISGGRAKLAAGLQGAALCAAARIETTRGSLFWARGVGFPALPNAFVADVDAVLGDGYDERRLEGDVRTALMTTPGAVEMTNFRNDSDRRLRKVRPVYRLRVRFDDTEVVVENRVARG